MRHSFVPAYHLAVVAKVVDISQVMAELKYKAELKKLELTGKEVQDLTESKLRAILGGKDPDAKLQKVLKDEVKWLTLRTNSGDKNLDQRQITGAIARHLTSGTIPDQLTSPQRAASQREGYAEEQRKAYHDEQAKLFSLLKNYHTAFDDLEVSDVILKRADGTKLTVAEFCNTLDEITNTFLLNTDIQDGSITSGKQDREQISELYHSCFNVAAGRFVVSSTFDDNILDRKSYNIWVKHVEMIASFAALAVALQKLLS